MANGLMVENFQCLLALILGGLAQSLLHFFLVEGLNF
jgi:hypothetical protein